MKATGFVRKLDKLGRLVIPIELCRTLNICKGDAVEFLLDGNEGVYIRKFDRAGDMEQVLDNFERVIRDKDYWLNGDQLDDLLSLIQEMREVVAEEEPND